MILAIPDNPVTGISFQDPLTGLETFIRAGDQRHAFVSDRGIRVVHADDIWSGNNTTLVSNHTHRWSMINKEGTPVDLAQMQMFHYLQDGTAGSINKPGTTLFGIQGVREGASLPSGQNVHEPERQGSHIIRGEMQGEAMVTCVMVGPMFRLDADGTWMGWDNVALGITPNGLRLRVNNNEYDLDKIITWEDRIRALEERPYIGPPTTPPVAQIKPDADADVVN